MNKELPTQVDKAFENTSDREIYKRFARHLEANDLVIYVENLSISQIFYSNLYKVYKTKEEHCHC